MSMNVIETLDITSNLDGNSMDIINNLNLGVGTVPPISVIRMAYEIEDWFNTLWQKRIELTINAGQVPTTQTNFPLLINDTYPDLIGEGEAELRFTGVDNIQLEYEIQKFDNSTGELIAWVKKPSVSDGDIIRIYFDNPAAVDEQNSPAVWNTNYKVVYHMNETSGVLIDSTGNAELTSIINPATESQTYGVPGKIGTAIEFSNPANPTYFQTNNPVNITGVNPRTVSAWVKTTAFVDVDGVFQSGETGTAFKDFSLRLVGTTDTWQFNGWGGGDLPPITVPGSINNFVHVVLVFQEPPPVPTRTVNVYFDSILVATGVRFLNTGVTPLKIGFWLDNSFNGTIEEMRISDVTKSADFIKTEFNNQNNPSAFYSTGTVESIPIISMQYEDLINMGYET